MTPEINIDYEKSLITKRLQIKPVWLEHLDMSAILMLAAGFVIYPMLLYNSADMNNPNDRVIAYSILPLSILFGIALIYKKLTEKRLTTIDTGFDRNHNRKVILDFMKSEGYNVIRNNKDFITAIRKEELMSWPRQINVLLDSGKVYVCMLTLSSKARVPSFLTAKSIIKDLRKFIAKGSQQATSAFSNSG